MNIVKEIKKCIFIGNTFEKEGIFVITFNVDISIYIDNIKINNIDEIIIMNDAILIRDSYKDVLYQNNCISNICEFKIGNDYIDDYEDIKDIESYEDTDDDINAFFAGDLYNLSTELNTCIHNMYGELPFRLKVYIRDCMIITSINLDYGNCFNHKQWFDSLTLHNTYRYIKPVLIELNKFLNSLCDKNSDNYNQEFDINCSKYLLSEN